MAPVRRSGRKRQATRLSLEGVERIEIFSDGDDGDREESQEEVEQITEDDEVSQDSEYAGDDVGPIEGEEEEDDDISMEDEFRDTDEYSSSGALSESDEGIDILRRRSDFIDDDDDGLLSHLHNPENHEDFHSKGKLERYASLYGQNKDELIRALRGRDKWGNNEIFPKRQVDENGRGGFHESFLRSDEATHAEATEDWEWYFEGGGRARFERYQKMREFDEITGKEYVTPMPGPSLKVLMGPRAKQKLVYLDTREWVRIEDIWREAEQEMQSQTQNGRAERTSREGWLFNAGIPVQDVTWVPVPQRKTQYLALSIDTEDNVSESIKIPAYSLSGPSPACIQFWAIPSSTEPEREGCMDYTSSPRLSFVLCTNWGNIKQMKWCPAPRDNRDETVHWVLLAGVWGDGKMRVVKLVMPDEVEEEEETSTRYIKVEKVAFEFCPPDTICTCLDWLSASHIAVGCANGFVAIWDLADYLSSSPTTNPRAYFYQPFHSTYILTILSCYPSHPDCLLTASMDGYVRLTSIHSPEADHVFAPRSRTGISVLGWSDAIQSAFSPEDNNIIRALAFRRFYSGFNMVRHPATVLCLDVGTTHTTLLTGGADGRALAFNPLRKLLYPRSNNKHITWFLHEWSRHDGGVTRFTEGFKPTRDPNPRVFREGLLTTLTVYEAKSAITHLVWNPNVLCGSWAVAAMADGIVRVEDLAV